MTEGKFRVAIFVDVKSAFDSVDHALMFEALSKHGFDSILCKVIAFLYEYSSINGFKIGKGVIQGGKLSPILFNYLYEDIKRKVETKWLARNLDPDELHFELFADDLLVILRSYKLTSILL